jgi:outer membrane protein
MNRSLFGVLLAFAVVLGVVGGVAGAADAAATKVGYVDLQRTLNETKVGKKAKAGLEKDKTKKQNELDKKQKDLQASAAELDKQRTVLKPEVLRQREQELQRKYVELQEVYVKLQQDLAKREGELIRDIFGKAAPLIEEIAKRDGYTLILEKSESAVLWADPATDITNEVNSRLDKGGGGGAAKGK